MDTHGAPNDMCEPSITYLAYVPSHHVLTVILVGGFSPVCIIIFVPLVQVTLPRSLMYTTYDQKLGVRDSIRYSRDGVSHSAPSLA